ncbi:hypothetical protein [Altererythrobacter fulvus]|uniref:hypothetical protein n=1 Tax=Caenibius fulvus TaxID=2126012 RepID=UPI003019C4BE
MHAIIRRLESGERWRAADFGLRLFGLALLGLCALASLWLFHCANRPPAHEATAAELVVGLVAVESWCVGSCLLASGQGLFKLVPLPRGGGALSFTMRGNSR